MAQDEKLRRLLEELDIPTLRKLAKEASIEGYRGARKVAIIDLIVKSGRVKVEHVQKALAEKTSKPMKLTVEYLDRKFEGLTYHVDRSLENLASTLINRFTEVLSHQRSRSISIEEFKLSLDQAISRVATPAGWAEFVELKKLVCGVLGLSESEFYLRAADLVERKAGEYELSPGGQEGITVRGTLYGLIKRR